MMETLQWLGIVLVAVAVWWRLRTDEAPDPRRSELREVEERLTLLLAAIREELARDLAVLEEMRQASSAPAQPFEYKRVAPERLQEGPSDHGRPFEYKRAAPEGSTAGSAARREWTAEQSEVLELLHAGCEPEEVARRLRKSPHEIRLLARLAGGVQKPA
ncbi:hypothetical protein HS125_14130 [bacterium]|nr:hypothetical protein [bacterium]